MTSYLHPYIQESIDLNSQNTDNYIMTIQYSLDGLSFTIFDKNERKYLCLKHYTISDKNTSLKDILRELQEREPWLLRDFHKVFFILDNCHNTLVPKKFYSEDMAIHYLRTLNMPSANVRVDAIGSDIVNIYPIDDDIIIAINNFREDISIRHASTIAISSLIREFSERTAETRAFVNVKNNHLELIVLDNDRLVFHNYFNFNTKEDFLYFILFSFEQLKLDNETIPLYFMGFIENNSSIVNLCSRYIRNIRFINKNNNLRFVNELNATPYYYHYTLYNTVSCE